MKVAELVARLQSFPQDAEVEASIRLVLDDLSRPMTDAERAREYRRRKRDAVTDRHDRHVTFVTEGVGGGLSSGAEKRAEKQGEESEIGSILTGGSSGDRHDASRDAVTVTRKKRARARAPEVPFPADFKPTESHRAYAAKHALDLELEVDSLRGWAEGRTAVSWNGTFSTRLANSVKFRRERPSGMQANARTRPAQPSHGVTGFEKAVFVR